MPIALGAFAAIPMQDIGFAMEENRARGDRAGILRTLHWYGFWCCAKRFQP